MKKAMIPKVRNDQLPALYCLIAGCDLDHAKDCKRCKEIEKKLHKVAK